MLGIQYLIKISEIKLSVYLFNVLPIFFVMYSLFSKSDSKKTTRCIITTVKVQQILLLSSVFQKPKAKVLKVNRNCNMFPKLGQVI